LQSFIFKGGILTFKNFLSASGKEPFFILDIRSKITLQANSKFQSTASAAMEAVIHGVPAIAISQVCKDMCRSIVVDWDFELACKVILDLIARIKNGSFPLAERKFLNVNIPPLKIKDCKGVKITKAGYREYGNDAHRHTNPRGEEYYWIGLHPLRWKPSLDSSCDFEAIKNGYVSISPIMLDMTSHSDIKNLENWLEK
jgi:5'-nucleotidase